MPATYEPIATTTLSSTSATINFNSITSSFTDLRLILVCTSTSAGFVAYRFNSDTATNYSFTELYGDGTAAASQRATSQSSIKLGGSAINTSATIPSLYTIDIFSYAGSTNKTTLNTLQSDFNGSGGVERSVGLYRNTAAITAINLIAQTSFGVGTTATLYGILKA